MLIVNESNKRRLVLQVPKVRLSASKNNFIYKATQIWLKLMPNILKSPCLVKLYDGTEIIIPGLCKNSDFTTPIAYIKTHATNLLLKNRQDFVYYFHQI